MLKRKVDDEPEEFSGLRDSLWRLCEIGEKKIKEEQIRSHGKSCHIKSKTMQGASPKKTKKRKNK